MGIQTREITIGDFTYEVKQLDAITGRKAFVRLCNILGPVFANAEQLQNENDAAALFGAFASSLKEADMDHFCEMFGARTEVTPLAGGGEPRTLVKLFFMEHFAGNYMEMLEWLAFCLQVNFESFFVGMQRIKDEREARKAALSAKAGSSSASPNT